MRINARKRNHIEQFCSRKDDDNDNPLSSSSSKFYDHDKLSKQVLIWISQVDPAQKTNPDPVGVGFYRPEMLPVSSLFRRPEESSDDDDDDDDE